MRKSSEFDAVKHTLVDLITQLYPLLGIKSIVKVVGAPLTYTKFRRVMREIGLDIEKRNVSPELRRIRAINAKNGAVFRDWPKKFSQERGIQGFYKSKSGSLIWLRSSWEYFYAKHLDQNNIDWKFEEKSYLLSTGESYRPDFFIYENGKLSHIVEIKSLYFSTAQKRLEKAYLAATEYNFRLVVLDRVELKQCGDIDGALKEWKKVRKLKKDIYD